jgi:hypothetical protein
MAAFDLSNALRAVAAYRAPSEQIVQQAVNVVNQARRSRRPIVYLPTGDVELEPQERAQVRTLIAEFRRLPLPPLHTMVLAPQTLDELRQRLHDTMNTFPARAKVQLTPVFLTRTNRPDEPHRYGVAQSEAYYTPNKIPTITRPDSIRRVVDGITLERLMECFTYHRMPVNRNAPNIAGSSTQAIGIVAVLVSMTPAGVRVSCHKPTLPEYIRTSPHVITWEEGGLPHLCFWYTYAHHPIVAEHTPRFYERRARTYYEEYYGRPYTIKTAKATDMLMVISDVARKVQFQVWTWKGMTDDGLPSVSLLSRPPTSEGYTDLLIRGDHCMVITNLNAFVQEFPCPNDFGHVYKQLKDLNEHQMRCTTDVEETIPTATKPGAALQ